MSVILPSEHNCFKKLNSPYSVCACGSTDGHCDCVGGEASVKHTTEDMETDMETSVAPDHRVEEDIALNKGEESTTQSDSSGESTSASDSEEAR